MAYIQMLKGVPAVSLCKSTHRVILDVEIAEKIRDILFVLYKLNRQANQS